MVLDNFFNGIFGWAINISPLFGITFVAASITLLTTIVYKYATDQKAIKAIRDELKEIQTQMKTEKDNPEKVMQLQKTMWAKNMESMKHNFKPMLITFLPIVIIFNWMRITFAPFGDLLWTFGWFGTYFVITLVLSFALRKLLKVY